MLEIQIKTYTIMRLLMQLCYRQNRIQKAITCYKALCWTEQLSCDLLRNMNWRQKIQSKLLSFITKPLWRLPTLVWFEWWIAERNTEAECCMHFHQHPIQIHCGEFLRFIEISQEYQVMKHFFLKKLLSSPIAFN